MPASEAYNYKVVRQFAVMTVVWGVVGMAVGGGMRLVLIGGVVSGVMTPAQESPERAAC